MGKEFYEYESVEFDTEKDANESDWLNDTMDTMVTAAQELLEDVSEVLDLDGESEILFTGLEWQEDTVGLDEEDGMNEMEFQEDITWTVEEEIAETGGALSDAIQRAWTEDTQMAQLETDVPGAEKGQADWEMWEDIDEETPPGSLVESENFKTAERPEDTEEQKKTGFLEPVGRALTETVSEVKDSVKETVTDAVIDAGTELLSDLIPGVKQVKAVAKAVGAVKDALTQE